MRKLKHKLDTENDGKLTAEVKRVRDSVTRWIECSFNFWQFTVTKICPIPYKINATNLKILQNNK